MVALAADLSRTTIQVQALIAEGNSKQEIVERLGIGIKTLYRHVKILEGLNMLPGNWTQAKKSNRRKRTEAIITAALRADINQQGIATLLQVSKERVRQICADMAEEGLLPEEFSETIPVHDAAQSLGLSPKHVSIACQAGLIRCRVIRGKRGVRYRIYKTELPDLPLAVYLVQERCCRYCRSYFVPSKGKEYGYFCSESCRQKRRHEQQSERDRKKPPRSEKALSIRMAKRLPSANGEWLTLATAVRRYELSPMQIRYLISTKVLAVKGHPSKLWRGRPVDQVAANQLEFVEGVYTGKIDLDEVRKEGR